MKYYHPESVTKTVRLLNICAEQSKKGKFDPKVVSRELKTCNATFYDAVALGMFERIANGFYKPLKDHYNELDAHKIIKYRKTKPARVVRKETPLKQPEIVFDAQYHIDALKAMGYTGTIEKKQVIQF